MLGAGIDDEKIPRPGRIRLAVSDVDPADVDRLELDPRHRR